MYTVKPHCWGYFRNSFYPTVIGLTTLLIKDKMLISSIFFCFLIFLSVDDAFHYLSNISNVVLQQTLSCNVVKPIFFPSDKDEPL